MSIKIPVYIAAALLLLLQAATARAEDVLIAPAEGAVITHAPVVPVAATDPLTVTGIVVDKTATDAVVARMEAITESKRMALRKLAETHMTPAEAQAFILPDDKVIAVLVRDFEIASEQIAAARYVGTFTVRFRNEVANYVNIYPAAESLPPSGAVIAPPVVPAMTGSVLVLPYYETPSGQLLLWEEANVWLRDWQAHAPADGGRNIILPLGDIGDIAAGSASDVWSGNTAMLDRLRLAYHADQVVVAVLNAPGYSTVIDVYSYADGRLGAKDTLITYAGAEGAPAMLAAAREKVVEHLRRPAAIAVPEDGPAARPVIVSGAPQDISVMAHMSFDSFAKWVEAQRRVTAAVPPVTLELRALTHEGASFSLKSSGTIENLQAALAGAGLVLSPGNGNDDAYALELTGD